MAVREPRLGAVATSEFAGSSKNAYAARTSALRRQSNTDKHKRICVDRSTSTTPPRAFQVAVPAAHAESVAVTRQPQSVWQATTTLVLSRTPQTHPQFPLLPGWPPPGHRPTWTLCTPRHPALVQAPPVTSVMPWPPSPPPEPGLKLAPSREQLSGQRSASAPAHQRPLEPSPTSSTLFMSRPAQPPPANPPPSCNRQAGRAPCRDAELRTYTRQVGLRRQRVGAKCDWLFCHIYMTKYTGTLYSVPVFG